MKVDYWYHIVDLIFLVFYYFWESFFTSDEQMPLLIFKIGTILGAAMEKLLKEALAKN